MSHYAIRVIPCSANSNTMLQDAVQSLNSWPVCSVGRESASGFLLRRGLAHHARTRHFSSWLSTAALLMSTCTPEHLSKNIFLHFQYTATAKIKQYLPFTCAETGYTAISFAPWRSPRRRYHL